MLDKAIRLDPVQMDRFAYSGFLRTLENLENLENEKFNFRAWKSPGKKF